MNIKGIVVEEFKNLVRVRGGYYYLIYSAFSFDDGEFKTEVFRANSDGEVIDTNEIYACWYQDRESMKNSHKMITNYLTEYLEGVI